MYILSLELTKNCNLNCRYCYLGEKPNTSMTFDIATKAIDIGIHEATKQYDKTILTYFIGGEPLLNYEMIRECVFYIEQQCNTNNLQARFSTTINGTLLNEEIIKFFIDKRFEFKVSIDGTEYVQGLNRKYFNRENSYKDIIRNIPLLKMYENEAGLRVHAAQVIDINNCKYIFESISHLKKLGFSIIETGINHFDEWDKTKIAILFNQLDICFDYYISLKQNNDSLVWIFFEAKLENFFSTVNFYSCKAGLCSIFVTTNGNIYPCTEIDSTVKIGDIYKGLNVRSIRNFAHIRQSENQEYLECLEYKHCVTSGCIMSNYEINGNIFKPVNIECLITKYVYNMFRNKLSKEQLSSFSEYFKEKERLRQWKQKII